MAYIYLALVVVCNAWANIAVKRGAQAGFRVRNTHWYEIVTKNLSIVGGLALFALNFAFYYLALRSLPLSLSYPVMVAGGFIIVNLYASQRLHEKITTMQFVGYGMIVLGIVLVLAVRP